ncbi:hypothetical protein C9F11_37695 [Streptomyces sp. YIM 121038]|nr:hypothetical protein C9F11_37695 [Streptomyces sp. YIM 121038]
MEQYPSRRAAAEAAGVSKDTWQRIEEGREVREVTYAKVDRGLGWAAGSCLAIAEGGEPVEVGYIETGPDVTMVSRLPAAWSDEFEDDVRQALMDSAIATTPDLPIGKIQELADQFMEALRKRAASSGPGQG